MTINHKVFVVTGGGNGMGREIVLNLLKKGAKVAAVDMRNESLEETKLLAGKNQGNLSIHQLNITDKKSVEDFPQQVISIHGSVDAIINNAGIIQPFVRVNNLDFESIEKVMNVNFYGTLYFIKAFLPHLTMRPEAHIANISSMGGFLPVPGQGIYGASKAAVKLLTEALYAELLNTKVRVSIIFPGAVGTNITANSGVSMPNMDKAEMQKQSIKALSPNKAAEIIVSGIENNQFQIFVGKDSKLMNFLYRLSPGFATRFIAKQMQALLPKG